MRMKEARGYHRRDELTRTITTPMMIESLGSSPIKMGKELRMAVLHPASESGTARPGVRLRFNALRNEVRSVIVGHDEVINRAHRPLRGRARLAGGRAGSRQDPPH
jgi:hypothetical protein